MAHALRNSTAELRLTLATFPTIRAPPIRLCIGPSIPSAKRFAILAQNSGRVIIGSDFQSGAVVNIGYDWGAVYGSAANGTVSQRIRLQVGNSAHTAKMNIDGCLWLPFSIMSPGNNWRCKWQ